VIDSSHYLVCYLIDVDRRHLSLSRESRASFIPWVIERSNSLLIRRRRIRSRSTIENHIASAEEAAWLPGVHRCWMLCDSHVWLRRRRPRAFQPKRSQ
jgi:hypothetical protein